MIVLSSVTVLLQLLLLQAYNIHALPPAEPRVTPWHDAPTLQPSRLFNLTTPGVLGKELTA